MSNVTLQEMADRLAHEVAIAVVAADALDGRAMEHMEEAQQMLTAMRYHIWSAFHRSGERG